MSALVLSDAREAWTQFVDGGHASLELLRPEVARSWERCRELSVNPYEEIETRATQIDLRERLYKNQRLINVARPAMDNLFNFVRGSGFQVVLTDEQGFLLEVLGENDVLSRTSTVDLCPGGNWSEAAKGTNAIGTAIVERAPVQIHAWEHYCQAHHFLTCSAAPIFDPDGELVGVLDMSGDYQRANAHTLGMVVAAVNAIENQLRLQRATEKLYTAYRYSNILLDSMSDGLVSIDTSGIVTEMNMRGGQIFGVDPALVKGRHISQIFPARPPVLQVISDGVGYEDREVVLDRSGRKIRSSASLLRDDAGNVIGAVAVFRPTAPAVVARPSLPAQPYTFADIIGDSAQITALKEWGAQAAASPSTVLIRGESGTGKELFAQAIHNASGRNSHRFVAINCAALPDSLIESELFGHEEGSFTGAKKGGHIGKFELADGGTIFLDEVGEMSLHVQAKLLRVLQERRVSRIGSTVERKVDIRVIAATNRDLYADVQLGRFRQDLYYRLHVVELTVPPLRERVEDIPALATYLMCKLAAKFQRDAFELQDGFVAKLKKYDWPGNIRELENCIERAIARAGNGRVLTLDMIDLPNQQPAATAQQPTAAPSPVGFGPVRTLAESERDRIAEALVTFEGNIQKTAAKLGIGRNTLYRKMKQYGLS